MYKSTKLVFLLFLGLLGACDGSEDLSEGDFYRMCAERIEGIGLNPSDAYDWTKDMKWSRIMKFSDAQKTELYIYMGTKESKTITAMFRSRADYPHTNLDLPIACSFVKEGSGWRFHGFSKL